MSQIAEQRLLRRAVAWGLPWCAVAAACTSNPAPSGWLPGAAETPTDPFGAWIEVEHETASVSRTVAGELIAVDRDTIFVLSSIGLQGLPLDSVGSARVAWFDAGYGNLILWTAVGALSTASHGLISGITFPLWVIGGTLATAAQSRSPIVDHDPDKGSAQRLSQYARYPQGMPEGLDRAGLTPRRSVSSVTRHQP